MYTCIIPMHDLFRYLWENFLSRLEVRSEKNQVNQPVPPKKKLCSERLCLRDDETDIARYFKQAKVRETNKLVDCLGLVVQKLDSAIYW